MNQPILPQVQPATPLLNGRQGHNAQYTPSPPYPHQPQPYHGYQYQYPVQYQRPPQQWSSYPVHMPMSRNYQPYPPMAHYQISQNFEPARQPPQHAPSSSSVRSAQGMLSPTSSNTSLLDPSPAPVLPSYPHLAPPTPPPPPPASPPPLFSHVPFYPPLPWCSYPAFQGGFVPWKSRRKRRPAPQLTSVELPRRRGSITDSETLVGDTTTPREDPFRVEEALPASLGLETPTTSHPPSEDFSTQPTTPSSTAPQQQTTPKANGSGRPSTIRPIIPAVPNLPIAARPARRTSASTASGAPKSMSPSNADNFAKAEEIASKVKASDASDAVQLTVPPAQIAPKSWAELFGSKGQSQPNANEANNGSAAQPNGFVPTKSGSFPDALSSYSVKENNDASKLAFLKPRGLVNTGNMCYMNSVLQILIFCVPFYNFLDKIGKQAVHSFKSDTPMMDAMILFMREFSIIDAATSAEQLRMRLKDNELEEYGDAFIPEFVYDVIRRLPKFSSMRRGHQQDAEEFLGFLLEELHEECSRAMNSSNSKASSGTSTPTNGITSPMSELSGANQADDLGWLEVGRKQKASITRSSGTVTAESPVNKIFGGKLRSELRVPGMKNSVTLEPYQPLQLDIGAPQVNNIIDALKGLTKPETLHGDFNSPRGPGTTATKQVTIETLPQVLILHLKRFQYNSTGGTQKIWKKVGYPLDLEIPKEVFPQHKRGGVLAHGGLPKYRLIGVVYHHGKNASGGHYTVDVRRQEGREWIRLDDTVIRRMRSEDVAEGGSEEDPKILAAALEQHKGDQVQNGNFYEQIAAEEEEQNKSEKGWSQVNGTASGSVAGKKWSAVANGNATPASSSGKRTPIGRPLIRDDNKVAYILFYQKINS